MPDNTPLPDDLPEFLRRMLSGEGEFGDINARLSEMGIDTSTVWAGLSRMQAQSAQDPWDQALQRALHLANKDDQGLGVGNAASLAEAISLANLWLGETTTISELGELPTPMTRGQWVTQTMPTWREIAEPVGTSVADALIAALGDNVPEEMQSMVAGAGQFMRTMGTSLFAAQLGQIIGTLSLEVVTGGDVSIPVLPAGTAAVIPQNLAAFGEGLEISDDQVALYLSARELAYARLYRHAKWLRLSIMSQITDFARGVRIDVDAMREKAEGLDPENLEELRTAIEGGALIPEHSEAQKEALARLEHLVAVIDGWVDVVTAHATARLPDATRLAETSRRRRAAGGPAENALGALVGLTLRPKRLREAAAMWEAITAAVGIEARDSLWDYSDLMPTPADIDDPAALIARLQAAARGEDAAPDDMDEALARLLSGEEPEGPAENPEAPEAGPGETPV